MRVRRKVWAVLLFGWAVFGGQPARPAEQVTVGVFGLFEPKTLEVRPKLGSALMVEMSNARFVADGDQVLRLDLSGSQLRCTLGAESAIAERVTVSPRAQGGLFWVSVPGKIDRRFRGRLEVAAQDRALSATVEMDLETAVASIVAAEARATTPMEALKAQAVVTRSYLLAAGPRHSRFDFCDSTHCQYLKAPPESHSAASRAAEATKGLVLQYRNRLVPALFSRSCGGKTHSLAEAGFDPGRYPYYGVACPACRRRPELWKSRVNSADEPRIVQARNSEPLRISLVRKLGWDAIPSHNFAIEKAGNILTLSGKGRGHGVGLCQRGAAAMAKGGDFLTILRHYFPDTAVASAEQ